MNYIIEINNLNLKIKTNTFISIIGSNSCGKSTLAKILVGLLKSESNIIIDNKVLNKNSLKEIRNIIGYLPENPDNIIIMDTVQDEFNMYDYDKNELNELLEELNINNILNTNPRDLSGGEKQIISFISQIIRHPKIMIIDESFSMIDNVTKDKIFKILKKEKNTTIINFTNDIEETLYGDEIAIISNKNIIISDKKENILSDEKLLKKINFNVPFIVDVSLKLKYYNLLNKIEWNINNMVNKLWK